jgi:glycosyltransferase involved in cell wall biosynthesis
MKNNQKKNIALFIPTLESGGSERMVINVSENIHHFYNILIITLYDIGISYPSKVEVVNVSKLLKNKSKFRVINFFKKLKALNKIVKKYNINAIFSFTNTTNNYLPFINSKIIKIASSRGFNYLKRFHLKFRLMELIGINILFNSIEMMKFYKKKYPNSRPSFLPNFLNNKQIDLKIKDNIEDSVIENLFKFNKILISVGQFSHIKAQHNIIKIFTLLREEMDNLKLLFIGHRGVLESETKSFARLSKFNKDIIFLGYTDNPFKYISKSYLTVHTSINEGFPNVLLESMYLGIPVITTNCMTGPAELLNQEGLFIDPQNYQLTKTGILCPVIYDDDPFNLNKYKKEHVIFKNAIKFFLVNNYSYYELSKKSIEVANFYTIENVVNKYVNYLNNLL